MVPKITKTGTSFSGAWDYYAHDKRSEQDKMDGRAVSSSNRVAWMHTENISGMKASRACADLMQIIASLNRRCEKPVYAFSLSWHPDQEPDQNEMIQAGQGALKALGMEEHMAVFFAHADTAHAHLHILVNRVDIETLKAKNNFQDFKQLSDWALGYEAERGRLYCPQRYERSVSRVHNQGRNAHVYADTTLLAAWDSSDDGRSFQAALEEHGWKLGLGDRKDRFMAVLPSGVPMDILRELNKTRDKGRKLKMSDLERRFADLKPGSLKRVASLQAEQERKTKDRPASCPDQQNADANLKKKPLNPEPPDERPWGDFTEAIEKIYRIEDIRQEIRAVSARLAKKGRWLDRLTGRHARNQAQGREELAALRLNLADALSRALEHEQRIRAQIRAKETLSLSTPAPWPTTSPHFSFPTGPQPLNYRL